MKRTFRLTLSKDIQRVKHEGKSISHPLLVMVFAMNDLPHNRFAFIASKAIGGAVQRNRAKRRMRALIASYRPSMKPGYDMIFIARQSLQQADHPALQAAVQELLEKAELLN